MDDGCYYGEGIDPKQVYLILYYKDGKPHFSFRNEAAEEAAALGAKGDPTDVRKFAVDILLGLWRPKQQPFSFR